MAYERLAFGVNKRNMPITTLSEGIFGFAEVTLDKAGRFVVPVEFFERLKGREQMRMLVDPLGRSLELWTEARFKEMVKRLAVALASLPGQAAEAILTEYLGYSLQVQIDNAYRLTIPKKFREILGEDEIVLVGVGECLKIWPKSRYRQGQEERRKVAASHLPSVAHAIYGLLVGQEQAETAVERG